MFRFLLDTETAYLNLASYSFPQIWKQKRKKILDTVLSSIIHHHASHSIAVACYNNCHKILINQSRPWSFSYKIISLTISLERESQGP